MPRRPKQAHLTDARKAAFLVELARCGVATRAAKAASPEAAGSCIQTFRDARRIDSDFARAWDAAIEQHAGDLLAELYRRAKDGDQIPIQNAKGELIGWRSVRSDKLLLEAVRAHVPMFTPKTVSEVTAKVRSEPMGLESLSPESQDELARILEREQARRRELPSAIEAEPYSALPIEERTR
jgi:hypothetical protein